MIKSKQNERAFSRPLAVRYGGLPVGLSLKFAVQYQLCHQQCRTRAHSLVIGGLWYFGKLPSLPPSAPNLLFSCSPPPFALHFGCKADIKHERCHQSTCATCSRQALRCARRRKGGCEIWLSLFSLFLSPFFSSSNSPAYVCVYALCFNVYLHVFLTLTSRALPYSLSKPCLQMHKPMRQQRFDDRV